MEGKGEALHQQLDEDQHGRGSDRSCIGEVRAALDWHQRQSYAVLLWRHLETMEDPLQSQAAGPWRRYRRFWRGEGDQVLEDSEQLGSQVGRGGLLPHRPRYRRMWFEHDGYHGYHGECEQRGRPRVIAGSDEPCHLNCIL